LIFENTISILANEHLVSSPDSSESVTRISEAGNADTKGKVPVASSRQVIKLVFHVTSKTCK